LLGAPTSPCCPHITPCPHIAQCPHISQCPYVAWCPPHRPVPPHCLVPPHLPVPPTSPHAPRVALLGAGRALCLSAWLPPFTGINGRRKGPSFSTNFGRPGGPSLAWGRQGADKAPHPPPNPCLHCGGRSCGQEAGCRGAEIPTGTPKPGSPLSTQPWTPHMWPWGQAPSPMGQQWWPRGAPVGQQQGSQPPQSCPPPACLVCHTVLKQLIYFLLYFLALPGTGLYFIGIFAALKIM